MTDKMRITFKKRAKERGLGGIARPKAHVDIKLNGKICGSINPPLVNDPWNKANGWKVYFVVIKADINEDNNPNCEWKWIGMKPVFETENEAREYVKTALPFIMTKYTLYFFE